MELPPMRMKLSDRTQHRYSKRERDLFSIVARKKRVDTVSLSKEYFGRRKRSKRAPLNKRMTILGALKGLANKMVANGEPIKLVKSKRNGPHPIEFWISARKN